MSDESLKVILSILKDWQNYSINISPDWGEKKPTIEGFLNYLSNKYDVKL